MHLQPFVAVACQVLNRVRGQRMACDTGNFYKATGYLTVLSLKGSIISYHIYWFWATIDMTRCPWSNLFHANFTNALETNHTDSEHRKKKIKKNPGKYATNNIRTEAMPRNFMGCFYWAALG